MNYLFISNLVPPQITPFDAGEEPINSGDMTSFFCTVHKGDLPIDIAWTLNDRSVNNIDAISVLRTNKRISQLSIDDVRAEHSGEYTCIAKNSAGIAKFSTNLNVNGNLTTIDLEECLFPS